MHRRRLLSARLRNSCAPTDLESRSSRRPGCLRTACVLADLLACLLAGLLAYAARLARSERLAERHAGSALHVLAGMNPRGGTEESVALTTAGDSPRFANMACSHRLW